MKQIKRIGIVGAGTMGAALAQKFAQENFHVILADREMSYAQKGIGSIELTLKQAVERRIFSEEQLEKILGNIKPTDKLADLKDCDLVIEAIFENFDAKKELFQNLGKIVDKKTIIATNTSSFSVTELSQFVPEPERFLGMHYFFHAAKNRLVEIIPGELTSEETFTAMKKFAVQSDKDAITCKDVYGFVVNRFFVPWLNESVRLFEERVATKEAIDVVCMKIFGIGMGPFALMNATGVPVAYHSQKTLEVFGNLYKASEMLREQTELNKPWDLEATMPSQITPATEKEIAERMLGVVFMVSSQILQEEVCTAVDINRGARIGLKWTKGPIDLMKEKGEKEVGRLIKTIAEKYQTELPSTISNSYWEMEYVSLEINDVTAIIVINKPEDLNALNEEIIAQLDQKFSIAEATPGVQNIIITGVGKSFVAGADIKFFIENIKSENIDKIVSFTKFAQSVLEKIDNSSKKVFALINGLTLGGGLELALCADVILAVPHAKMSFPETGIGIYPGLGGTQRTQQRVGKGIAKYLIFTGEMLDATEAKKIGLIDDIISPEIIFDIKNRSKELVDFKFRKQSHDGEYQSIEQFFNNHPVKKIFQQDVQDDNLSSVIVEKIRKKISRKAPIALEKAEKLINEANGCAAELDELKSVFATQDALTGLSSVGKKVEFKGK